MWFRVIIERIYCFCTPWSCWCWCTPWWLFLWVLVGGHAFKVLFVLLHSSESLYLCLVLICTSSPRWVSEKSLWLLWLHYVVYLQAKWSTIRLPISPFWNCLPADCPNMTEWRKLKKQRQPNPDCLIELRLFLGHVFGPALLPLDRHRGPLPRDRLRRDFRDLPHEGPLAAVIGCGAGIEVFRERPLRMAV